MANTTILSADMNDDLSDIADGLTGSIAADGQTPITGALQGEAGTLAAPGYSWAVDPNTGRYRPSADAMTDVVGGVAVLEESSTGVNFPLGATVAGNQIIPAGIVLPYAGSSAPTGFLLCFGQSLLRTDYAALFTAIGTTYGAADGTHFSLPDLRGRLPAGKDDMGGSAAGRLTSTTMTPDGITLGATGGEQTHTLVTGELAAHSHTANVTDPGHTHDVKDTLINTNVLAGGISLVQSVTSGGSTTNAAAAISNTTGITVATTNTGSDTAHNNVQPSIILNYIIKT